MSEAFRPATEPLESTWAGFFQDPDVREEIESIMALLGCEAWQAVCVRQVCRISSLLHEQDDQDDGPVSWGPGASPP